MHLKMLQNALETHFKKGPMVTKRLMARLLRQWIAEKGGSKSRPPSEFSTSANFHGIGLMHA